MFFMSPLLYNQVTESTPSIAPRTPMQSSLVWQKPPTHETPESVHSLPSLTLGRGSFERQKAVTTMPLQKQIASKSPSKNFERIQFEVQCGGPALHKDDLLTLSFSKHEKQYGEELDLSVALGRPHTGHLPQHSLPAMPGLSKVLPVEVVYSKLDPELTTPSRPSCAVEELGLQLLPGAVDERRRNGDHSVDDRIETAKRLKYTPMKEDRTPINLIAVKKESAEPENRLKESDVKDQQRKHVVSSNKRSGPNSDGASAQTNVLSLATSYGSPEKPNLPLCLEPSLSLPSSSVGKTSVQGSSSADNDWGKFLALSATPVANHPVPLSTTGDVMPFQQRFKQLQAYLKKCDEADQTDCFRALRSLSAAARSGYAVELETKAIKLSLEEGKEMKRMVLLNVLGKASDKSLDDVGATPQGPKLPAPGTITKLKHVS